MSKPAADVSDDALAGDHRRERSLTALVILEAVGVFFVAPLSAVLGIPLVMVAVLTTAAVGVVLVLVRHNSLALAAILVATALEVAASVLRYLRPSRVTDVLDFAAAVLFLIALTAVLAFVVFSPGRITFYRIQGAIAIYLNVAVVFASAYRLLDILSPGSFSPSIAAMAERPVFTFIYFSFQVLTTLGLGDILPIHPFARSLVNLESVLGQLFPAIVLARLVSLEIANRREAGR